jgi:ABC-type glycerol-3-phosphate transport system substrate-binding protein
MKGIYHLIIFLSAFLLLSACDTKGEKFDLDDDDKLVAEQLVIWWDEGTGVPHKSFAEESLSNKFPNTTFRFTHFRAPPPHGLLPVGYSSPNLLEMMRSEPSPDLIVFDTRFLSLMIEADYLEPISDTYGLEMDYDIVTEVRSVAPDFVLYALPFGRIAEGLFYNKTYFDMMNVPYPRDGMTWDEVIELAKALKRGKESPIYIKSYDSMASQLSLRWYDPETEQMNFESDEWKELTRILVEMNDLVEYRVTFADINSIRDLFLPFVKGESAMVVSPLFGHQSQKIGLLHYESSLMFWGVDLDIASFPVFDNEYRLRPADYMLGIGIPKKSANKEDALKVLRHLLSHEVQSENSRKGLISMRADADMFADEFGSSTILAGKSVKSLLSGGPKGERDQVYEFINTINTSLESMVTMDDIWRDTVVEKVQGILRERIMNMLSDRKLFIEEMREKL